VTLTQNENRTVQWSQQDLSLSDNSPIT